MYEMSLHLAAPKCLYPSKMEGVWLRIEYGKLSGCRLRVVDMATVLFLIKGLMGLWDRKIAQKSIFELSLSS